MKRYLGICLRLLVWLVCQVVAIILIRPWARVVRRQASANNMEFLFVANFTCYLSFILLFFLPVISIVAALSFGIDTHIEDIFDVFSSNESIISRCNKNQAVICYNGTIEANGAQELHRILYLKDSDIKGLLLQSGGGSLAAGDKIIADIIEKHLIVFIRRSGKSIDCGSECVRIVSKFPKDIENSSIFMFHVTRLGLLRNYGPLIRLIIQIVEINIDIQFIDHINTFLGNNSSTKSLEATNQAETADLLEGIDVKNGRLRRSIEACSPPNPFETIKGISLSWLEISSIFKDEGPVHCPR